MLTKRNMNLCVVALTLILTSNCFAFAAGGAAARNKPVVPLPDGKEGEAYEFQLRTAGGTKPLTWRVLSGELPAGVVLDASGRLSGKPTTARDEPYSFVIEVSDSSKEPERTSQELQLAIKPGRLKLLFDSNTTQPAAAIAKPANTNPGLGTTRVCGQLTLASLGEVLSVIRTRPDLEQFAKELRDPHSAVRQSSLKQDCDRSNLEPGEQKGATVDLLKRVLKDLTAEERKSVADNDSGFSTEVIRKEIEFLESHLGNVIVRLDDQDGKIVSTAMTDQDGNYEFVLSKKKSEAKSEPESKSKEELKTESKAKPTKELKQNLKAELKPESKEESKGEAEYAGPYTISTQGDNHYTRRTFTVIDGGSVRVNLPIEDRPVSLFSRAIVGYQQAASASTALEQNIFFDLFVAKSLPFRQKIDPDFGERFRTWTVFRAISLPQSGETTIGDLATGLPQQVADLKAKDAARVLDFLAGIEMRIAGNRALLPSFDRETRQKFSLSLIGGFGFVTPTNPTESVTKFKVSDQVRAAFPIQTEGKDVVAFVRSDRDRFFRQYYGGIRLQGFFFNRFNVPIQRFPIQADFTVGQNEYVTGGRLHGPVLRFDGYFPLPYDGLKFLSLYASAVLIPSRVKTGIPLILDEAAESGTQMPPPKIAFIESPQPTRDYYKIGVGIDFLSFVQKLRETFKKQ